MGRVLLLIASVVAVGAALAQSSEDRLWQAPPEAAAKTNPLRDKPEFAAGGRKVFEKTCSVCHEAGEKQKGPKLDLAATQNQSDGALFWKISKGNSRSGMPSFSSLPDGQRWQLVLYIRTLAHPAK
jgi:mono/diheme cytochrome c family protein